MSTTLHLDTMNIEITTNCPLHCPQCYCSLTGGKNIDPDTAIYWIKEGAKAGVKYVMLSGGETLCYPHIYELIEAAVKYCGFANVALSGYKFTQEVYEQLLKAGVSGIFISLNGSQKKSTTKRVMDIALQLKRFNSCKRITIPTQQSIG